jgi:FMN phosphatase YigB (HAD superfamily)
MVENQRANYTLEEAFDAAFYPALNVKKEDIFSQLFEFYENIFPQLKKLTTPRPAARRLVEELFQNQYDVVIATNPLFPVRAIQHRLEWAGLSGWMKDFRLITSYETFHYAKPKIEYYAEILARLGWPDTPVAMVGNSLSDDIIPASQLGIPIYFVSEKPTILPAQIPVLAQSGPLDGVSTWLDIVRKEYTPPSNFTRRGLIAALDAAPAFFDYIFSTIPAENWHIRTSSGEWDLTEIICHLRDVDLEINYPRLQKILSETSPFLAGVVSDQWAIERNYHSQDTLFAFNQFLKARAQITSLLLDFSSEQWLLPAQHAIFGPTTLFELVSFMQIHDRSHIQQGLQTMQPSPTQV